LSGAAGNAPFFLFELKKKIDLDFLRQKIEMKKEHLTI